MVGMRSRAIRRSTSKEGAKATKAGLTEAYLGAERLLLDPRAMIKSIRSTTFLIAPPVPVRWRFSRSGNSLTTLTSDCRLIKVATEGRDRWLVTKVNTEDLPVLAQRFRVNSIPAFALLKSGREVARQSGAMPAPAIRQFIEQGG